MYNRFLSNHVFANLVFALVILIGSISYMVMPREKDPTINFNWVQVWTLLPGASAGDIEKKITDPLEEAIRKVDDIRFVTSSSRESLSNILLRFDEIDERTFDKRVNDLRREIQAIEDAELPKEAESPVLFEITTDNAFPTATIVVTGLSDDETLRQQTYQIKKELASLGEREVSSRTVGEKVVKVLAELDHVAYVRFASVYRSFQDVNEFREVIERKHMEVRW